MCHSANDAMQISVLTLALLLSPEYGVLTLKGPDLQKIRTTEKKPIITYTYDVKYYINSRKYWCKGYYRNHCTIIASTTTETKNIKVDDDKNGKITVILTDLSTSDSGDYWCGIEIYYVSDDMHYTRLEVYEAPEDPAARTQDQFLTVMSVLGTLIIIAAVILLFKIFCSRKRTERTEVLGLRSSPSTADKASEDPEVDEYDCKYADLHIKPQSSVKDSQDVAAKEEVAYSDVMFK
ncbi:transmembrane domain-containing protein TMIGD3-like isoform X2 [Polypterus senegalus]|uniref:transmembrane domain-containing protein TMIGD3-like isoform X2 n=1 Tax=Polypterus senegalus TaxID=55291 RepID=UPI001962E00C|nr:transmembrane domain-containing protein TMIGD3-like isoform X2 [Polypterus senegalus]